MTDDNTDDEPEEESGRDKHAIRGGTEFVEKLYGGDGDEDDEEETDE